MLKIFADSTCDLSPELIERYDLTIIPLHIHLGEEAFEDGVNVTPDEIYAWSDAHNATPKTSAVSIAAMEDLFSDCKECGDEIICFSISDGMSSTGQVMRVAAENVEYADKVHVVNSANLSTGIGLQVIEAAEMVKAGKNAEEILEHIEAIKPMVRASFVVDTLTFLHRGGRCSSVAALAGGVLKLHPRIVVEDGKMHASKKYRGRMPQVILSYVKDMEEDLKNAHDDRVFITHSGCDQEILNSVKEYLEGLHHFKEILITRAGGVISSHCGPGTLGVLFIAG
ncbi:MAG: DegV family protein [Oscillospiraceae bacterium]|nr:DegV family protein [Oscillospiraceae bacterium]